MDINCLSRCLSVVPSVNMVSNIGFGPDARTQQMEARDGFRNPRLLRHGSPLEIEWNASLDAGFKKHALFD